MPRIQTFARDLQLATAGIAPDQIQAALAKFARAELANVIASGEGSDAYEKYINGRLGDEEETVVVPGPILYVFHWWTDVLQYALQYLIERSPEKSGRYKRSWFVMVNNAPVGDFSQIPINATVMITNDQPYSRKIDVGHMQMSVPHQIVEDGKKAVMRIFGNIVTAKRTMITLPGGYVLKGRFRRGFRPHARTGLKKDTQAGAQMTYPALSLSMRSQ